MHIYPPHTYTLHEPRAPAAALGSGLPWAQSQAGSPGPVAAYACTPASVDTTAASGE